MPALKTAYAQLKGLDASQLAQLSTGLAKVNFGLNSDLQVIGVDRNPARLTAEVAIRRKRQVQTYDETRGALVAEERYEYRRYLFTADAEAGVISTTGASRDLPTFVELLGRAGAPGAELAALQVDLVSWANALLKHHDTAQVAQVTIDSFYAEPKLIGRFSAKSVDNRLDPKQLEELGGSLRSIRFAFFHQGVRRSVEARGNAVLSLTSADEEDLAEFNTEQERLLLKHAKPREAGP